tara:strand:- start:98 stop:1054 length:957 start_codon:yes stop_codon:yes gene_type:complete
MKRVLILGSCGFIGRNVCEIFDKNNFYIYGTYFNNKPIKNSRVKYIKADLTKKNIVEKIVKGMDIVIQAAAVTGGIKDAKKNAVKYIVDNAIMNSIILESIYKNKIKHFIFLSCTVMYHSSKKPLKENDFDANGKIYPSYFGGAWNKIYIEKMCEFYSKISKIKFTVLRHSNVYGPYDKFDLNKSHACSATIKKIFSSKNNKIKVWGNGKEKRDFLFVYDLVEAIKLSISKQKNKFEIFNIGSSKPVSINNLVKEVIKISNKKINIEYDKTKPTNKFSLSLNCNKAKKLLNWKPDYDLNQGLKLTINWYKNNLLNNNN